MKEELIIKIIQDYIATTEWLEFDHVTGEVIREEDYEAIKGLLELYKKQQKEIEELKKHKEHEQEYQNGEVFSAKQMHYIEENYIDKDKIREKINYYDERGYIEIAGAFKLLLEE